MKLKDQLKKHTCMAQNTDLPLLQVIPKIGI